MQDPFSMYPQMNAQVLHPHNSQAFPEQENLKCPRCDSTNTKFCYFNNYNLSQPRHYCRNCRRYWTKGGSLRNVPVGGGSRKNAKRTAKSSPKANPPSTSQRSSNETETASEQQEGAGVTPGPNPNSKGNNFSGYFGKLIQGGDTLGSLMGPSRGHFPDGFGLSATHLSDHNKDSLVLDTGNSNRNARGNDSDDGFLSAQGGDADRWNGTMGPWPDLHIYTPGSTFQ